MSKAKCECRGGEGEEKRKKGEGQEEEASHPGEERPICSTVTGLLKDSQTSLTDEDSLHGQTHPHRFLAIHLHTCLSVFILDFSP